MFYPKDYHYEKKGDHEIEMLPCGHQNNLKLPGRTKGVCPKCGETFDDQGVQIEKI